MLKRNIFIPSIWVLLLSVWALPAWAELILDTAWVRRYDGPDHLYDEVSAIAVDDSGNVYVTGRSKGAQTRFDYATVRYYPDGDTAWLRRYNGLGNGDDYGRAIDIDAYGNVYVTGWSTGIETGFDYVTIKYYPNGDTAWVRTYNEPGNPYDYARAVVVDGSGNVYVTGWRATIKYDCDGNQSWIGSGGNGRALLVDDSDNVYVVGTDGDYTTTKLYPNGDTAWVRTYDGPGHHDDLPTGIAIDDSGNVYVTGGSWGDGTMEDYATIKYYPNGDTAWVRRYNGSRNSTDHAYAIAVDGSNNVYVTGCARNSVTSDDYLTVKYYPNGDMAWVRGYDAALQGDAAYAMALDGSGNVYVTGQSYGSQTLDDYATIKYYSNGDSAWVRRYNGPGNAGDQSHAIGVDASGNVYVGGASDGGSATGVDYVTIKYSPSLRWRGDANGDGSIDIGDVVYLINYLYKYGSAPDPVDAGDCNCDGMVNVGDVVYLVNYLYRGGDPPSC